MYDKFRLPNLFYLLFLAGLVGLGYELTHPGIVFPGVFGAICLILALIATSVLPVSFGAAALILVGIAFLIGEAFVALSHAIVSDQGIHFQLGELLEVGLAVVTRVGGNEAGTGDK